MRWLTMPVPVVHAYAGQLARLQAEERVAGMSDGRVAAGQARRRDAQRHVDDLMRRADPGRRPVDPGRLRAAGIAVERR